MKYSNKTASLMAMRDISDYLKTIKNRKKPTKYTENNVVTVDVWDVGVSHVYNLEQRKLNRVLRIHAINKQRI
jgi:hypothetical protein